MSDLYPLVVLTKIDKLCTTTEEDTTKVFSSRAVDEKVSFYLYKATKISCYYCNVNRFKRSARSWGSYPT